MGFCAAFSSFLRLSCVRQSSSSSSSRTSAALLACGRAASSRHYYRRPLPPACISFYSPEGKQLFKEALEAGHMDCYFQLAAQFRTQDEPAFCGLTTLVIVLNALAVDPHQVWKGVWRWYHEDMLECCVSKSRVLTAGITLSQFACLAECNGLKAATVPYASDGLPRFRDTVKAITRQDDEFLVASYSRRIIQQTGDGHFSPIAGYHPGRDLALVLDTARFKYPPHWVDLATLYDAMEAADPSTGKPRGYCVVKKNCNMKASLFSLSGPLAAAATPDDATAADDGATLLAIRSWSALLTGLQTASVPADEHALAAAFLDVFAGVTSLSKLLRVDANGGARCHTSPATGSGNGGGQVRSACLYDSVGHWNFLVRGIEQTGVFRACDRLLEGDVATPRDSRIATFVQRTREEIKRTMLWCKDRSECSSSAEHYAKASRLAAVLRPAHALAMLLLSWPYDGTAVSGGSDPVSPSAREPSPLQALVSAAVAAHDNMVLASEVSTLRETIANGLRSDGGGCELLAPSSPVAAAAARGQPQHVRTVQA